MIQILVTPTVTANTNNATATGTDEAEPFYRIDVRTTQRLPELYWMDTTQFLPMKEGIEFIKVYCMLACCGCRSVLSERVASEVPSNTLARQHLMDEVRSRYRKEFKQTT